MVQMGGWGKRSPFSRMSGISRVGMPSYGLPPNVISSQIVTPKKRRRNNQEWEEKVPEMRQKIKEKKQDFRLLTQSTFKAHRSSTRHSDE